MKIESNKQPEKKLPKLNIANPYGYATYADAQAAFPNLSLIPGAESIYDIFSDLMNDLIDAGRYGKSTGRLSLYLTLHFFCNFVQGITNTKFYPDDYDCVSGAIDAISANGVSTSYAQNSVSGNWESALNQTDFGITYLTLAKAINLAIGVDGMGNPWALI